MDQVTHRQEAAKQRKGWFRRKREVTVGASPGTLIQDPCAPKPVLRLIAYGPDEVVDRMIADPQELPGELGKRPVSWLNVDGLGDVTMIKTIGEMFGVHRLALEDVINVQQRAKAEDYDEHEFIVVRQVNPSETLDTEQFSIFLGRNYVLTFQEKAGDFFDPVRKRIREGKGRLRGAGPDYLAYALIDALIDSFFPVIERYGDELDKLETLILEAADHKEVIRRIHSIKRDLLTLRRCIWPQREALSTLLRDESRHVSRDTRVYLRDCYDHIVQLIDLLETYRELAASLMEAYLSTVSNRMNEVMKVLTVIATIFIPLTFVVGVYGMNFDYADGEKPWNMPELHWRYGYPLCIGAMLLIAGGMLYWFRKRKWI